MIFIGICFMCSDNHALDIFEKLRFMKEKSPFDLHKDTHKHDHAHNNSNHSSGERGTPDAMASS